MFGGGGAATGGFGATPSAFGAPAPAPAFGAGGSSFGAPASSSPFGAAGGASAFGSAAPAAAPAPPGSGSRSTAYRKTQDTDASSTGGAKTIVFFDTIVAQPAYAGRSTEELRWEDYAAGVKGSSNAAGPAAALASTSTFGAPQPASSLFGGGTSAAPSFGAGGATGFGGATQQPAFGASPFGAPAPTPTAFGAPPSTPATGLFGGGASATPAFGAAAAPAASSPFGAAPTPAFGAAGGGLFGGASTSTPSTPAFGGGGALFGAAASTPAFSSAPSPFGAPAPAATPSLFGGGGGALGAAAPSPFGAQPAASAAPSLFGAQLAAPAAPSAFSFGGAPAASTAPAAGGLFGVPPASSPAPTGGLFGAPASTPATGGLFGAPAATTGGLFGVSTPVPAGGGLFGAPAAPAAPAGGLFGAPAASTAPTYGLFGAPAPAASAAPTGGFFGSLGGGALTLAQPAPAAPAGPYGSLPPAPAVDPALAALPEPARTGLAARTPPAGAGGRPAALLIGRGGGGGASARLAARLRPPGASNAAANRPTTAPSPAPSSAAGTPAASTLAPRDDPRAFFVRTPLPSTAQADGTSPSPVDGAPPPRGTANGHAAPSPDGGVNGHTASPRTCAGAAAADLPTPPTGDGAYMEPSLDELASSAAADPSSLARVRGLVVGVRGVGSVRWLDPVDLRSAHLPTIVRIGRGAVEVYPDDTPDKPDVGCGLNGRALVTLEGVHKRDRGTGAPTTDAAAVDRFAKRLRRLAADQGARFVGYDADGGVWRFEVDHFSRYGLVPGGSDDDDNDDDGGGDNDSSAARRHRRRRSDGDGKPVAGAEATADSDSMHESDDATVPASEGGGGGDTYARPSPDDAPLGVVGRAPLPRTAAALSPELAVALPARLGLDAGAVASARAALFGGGGGGAREAPPPATGGVVVDVPAPPSVDLTLALLGGLTRRKRAPPERVVAEEEKEGGSDDGPPPLNLWAPTPATSITHPTPLGVARPLAPPALPPPRSASPLRQRGVAAAAALALPPPSPEPAGGEARLIVDAGAVLGRSFRVGWGPGGVLAAPGPGGTITLRRLPLCAPLLPPSGGALPPLQARWLARWRAALTALAGRVTPVPGSGAPGGLPRAVLTVDRGGGLRSLVLDLLAAVSHAVTAVGRDPASCPEAGALVAEAWAWELVDGLWSRADGDAVPPTGPLPAPPLAPLPPGPADDGAFAAAAVRRAHLSRWLRDRCASDVDAALSSALGGAPDRVAALLAGGRPSDAVSEAIRHGDVRLAALIPAAAAGSAARSAVGATVAGWDADATTPHIAPGRAAAYRLLAGDVEAVAPTLARSWRQAVGLQLWWGVAPGAPAGDAVAAYEDAAAAGAAPQPAPPYAAHGAPARVAPPAARPPAPATDAAFRLLQLATRGADPASSGGAIAALATPTALTPDALDALPGWALACVARAVGALPDVGGGSTPPPPADSALHAAAAAALEATGAPEWAVLPLLFIGDGAGGGGVGATRDAAVSDLLSRHAPRWASHPAAAAVLTDTLHIPQSWLAAAAASWARSRRDAGGEFEACVAAGAFAAAHDVLASRLAPSLLASRDATARGRLTAALTALAPHAEAIDAERGAGTWRAGAGVFALFLDLDAADGDGPPPDRAHDLLDALHAAGGGTTTSSPALAEVAASAARWVLGAARGGAAALADAAASGLALPQLRSDARAGLLSAAAAAVAEAAS